LQIPYKSGVHSKGCQVSQATEFLLMGLQYSTSLMSPFWTPAANVGSGLLQNIIRTASFPRRLESSWALLQEPQTSAGKLLKSHASVISLFGTLSEETTLTFHVNISQVHSMCLLWTVPLQKNFYSVPTGEEVAVKSESGFMFSCLALYLDVMQVVNYLSSGSICNL